MAFSKGNSSITLQEILSKVSEVDLLTHYIDNIKALPCIINSPLREDTNPSFGLYLNNDKVKFIDFATRDSGGIIDLLSKLWRVDYINTLSIIEKDLSKFNKKEIVKSNISSSFKSTIINNKCKNKLECKIREWRKYDLEYWESYGISLKWLKFGDVFPISHIIYKSDDYNRILKADKYAYVYVERKENITLKIYQPYSIKYKWRNSHNRSVWDLWNKLPNKGEHLIITSSRKDALCIWENSGIPTCNLQSESYIPKKHVVYELKLRFKNIYVLYDNDFQNDFNVGRQLGENLSTVLNLKQIEIPTKYKSKDASDLAKNYGRNKVKEVILELIK